MVRDKNATLQKTCIFCRQKINYSLKLKCAKVECDSKLTSVDQQSEAWGLKVIFMESFCMAFGLPSNHPFLSIFLNKKSDTVNRGRLCFQCFEDVSTLHHIFWQFSNLERKLSQLQTLFLQRLRSNYDAIPVPTLFSSLGEDDILNNLERLKYDEIVKILFEKIKDAKDQWPKPTHSARFKEARDNSERIAGDLKAIPQVKQGVPDTAVKSEQHAKVEQVVNNFPLTEDHDYLNISHATIPTRPKRASAIKAKLIHKAVKELEEEEDGEFIIPDYGQDDTDFEIEEGEVDIQENKQATNILPRKRKPKEGRNISQSDTTATGMRFLCVEDPEVCCRTYSSRKHLMTHVKTFHKVRKFACDYEGCKVRYESEEKLESHKSRVHSKLKVEHTEICETCGIELPRKDMKRHCYLRHVGIGKFTCDICSMDFNDSAKFDQHKELHKDAEFPFSCVVCQKLFTNSIDLRGHVTSNHLSSGIKCDICGIMKPNDFLLRRHMKCHEKVKSFNCSMCKSSFTGRAYLNYHVEHFHENKGKRYPCEVCGKTFSHLKNVLRHMVTHQEEKPYQCKICQKTFNYSHLLKKHEEIHSNTKNYGCEICGKRFRQEQNLRQHMRSHKPKAEKNPNKKQQTTSKLVTEKIEILVESLNEVPSESDVMSELKINAVTGANAVQPVVPHVTEVEKQEQNGTVIEENAGTVITTVPSSAALQVGSTSQIVLPTQTQAQSVRQIQLTLPTQQQQPTGTTTVVFVTSDQNFHWIT